MFLSKRVEKIAVSPTMKIAQQAIEMKLKGIDIIDFSVGEPDFPTPENIKEAAKRAIDSNFTKYTVNAGTVELRNAIAEKLKKDNNLEYSHKNIIVSNGAKHSVFNAIQSMVDSGDEVIIPAPYYVSYPEMVKIAQGNPIFVNTNEETNFKITPNQLKNTITSKTKLFILCSPSNPTGAVYSKGELEELADIIESSNFYILSDEIYEKIIYDDFQFTSIASLSNKIKERTITINGHSKSYSMTGWRIGYTAAEENIINAINKYQSHSTSNASSISQAAALEALIGQQDTVKNCRKEFENRRDLFHEGLISIDGITCYKPKGAFYLFPNVSAFFNRTYNSNNINNSNDLALFLLQEAKVAVVSGTAFGAEGYLRLSYSTSTNNIIEGLKRLKAALALLL